jgi:uncharacterized membrane protein (DUF2068 family)
LQRFDGIRFVALLKFGKALLVLATAYGAYRLLDPATGALLTQWSETVTDRFVRNIMLGALAWIASLNASAIHSAEAVTAAYFTLLLVEGVGLWLHQRWAEWLTVIATSTLIPFEVWKLILEPNGRAVLILGVLAVNAAIVVYLGLQLRLTAHPVRQGADA